MFPTTYEESRARFRATLDSVRSRWPGARPDSYALRDHPELSIDWIAAEAPRPRRLFMLTTGIHGIEGYVGAAMMDLFVAEFLPRLDPQECGLILLHAINPWGMKHHRRSNPQNVDLNRNFITRWDGLPEVNPEYDRLPASFASARPLGSWTLATLGFYGGVARSMLRLGVGGSREAILRGQYRHAQGLYFGGTETQEEAGVLMGMQEAALAKYDQIVHLDMHTGYGPRTQMSLVNAASEPAASEECARNFCYPLVVKTNPDEFYSIHGDMTEYWYEMRQTRYPDKPVYAAAFEFGTFGDSMPAAIRSLRATILENRLHLHGASDPAAGEKVRREYEDLFNPSDAAWREKALLDARQAFEGILRFYGMIVGTGGIASGPE